MDPNATLEIALYHAKVIQKAIDTDAFDPTNAAYVDLIDVADTLAEAVTALDGWLQNGGFLPKKWER